MVEAYAVFWSVVVIALVIAFFSWRIVGETARRQETKNAQSLFRNLSFVFIAWIGLTVVLVFSPAFRTPWLIPFNPALLLVVSIFTPVVTNMLLLRLPQYRQLVLSVPLERVVLLHSFRVLLGVGLLALFGLGYLPSRFGLEAGIGDIAVGLTALPVALLLNRKVKYALTVAIVWNVFGMLDLLNALRLGVGELIPFVVSTQTPLLMGMIPLLAVPIYVIWHLYTFRLLRLRILHPVSYSFDITKTA
jgi:hypothetical protein